MKRPARAIAIAVAIFVVAFSVILATQVGSDPRAAVRTREVLGDPLPAFSVETLDGQTLTEQDLLGRAVIVNFWNSWCIPCEEELPALKEFYKRHAGEPDFMMLGIVRSDTESEARKAVTEDGMEWVIALDPGADAALSFGTRGQPETFAITADGRIAAYLINPARVSDLEAMLAAARRAGT